MVKLDGLSSRTGNEKKIPVYGRVVLEAMAKEGRPITAIELMDKIKILTSHYKGDVLCSKSIQKRLDSSVDVGLVEIANGGKPHPCGWGTQYVLVGGAN